MGRARQLAIARLGFLYKSNNMYNIMYEANTKISKWLAAEFGAQLRVVLLHDLSDETRNGERQKKSAR